MEDNVIDIVVVDFNGKEIPFKVSCDLPFSNVLQIVTYESV